MNGDELQGLSRGWPGVASNIKYEDDLVFTVAGKLFAVYCLRGPHRQRVSFKVDPERYLELIDQPGITPAAFMARAFWISIAEPDRFSRAKMSEFFRHSYDLVRGGLSKKQQAALVAKEQAQPAVETGKVAKTTKTAIAPKTATKAASPSKAAATAGVASTRAPTKAPQNAKKTGTKRASKPRGT